jgi:molybdenum-dependent DNA-binding transcriptional regulator ModE
MGRKSSIDEKTGARLLEAYGRLGSKSAAARKIGVSEDAADRYLRDTPKAAAPVVAQQRQVIEVAGASLWDTRQALDENYGRLLGLMARLEDGILEERQGSDGPYTTMTPIAVHVATLKEIREHIKTAMDLGKLLIDIEEVRKFQQAVLEAIGEADDATRQRIIAKLRQQRALGLISR